MEIRRYKMSVNVQEVKGMSKSEILFTVDKFTEEYLFSEGWSRWAIKHLHKRYDKIMEKRGEKK
jgi:hypothetical protein